MSYCTNKTNFIQIIVQLGVGLYITLDHGCYYYVQLGAGLYITFDHGYYYVQLGAGLYITFDHGCYYVQLGVGLYTLFGSLLEIDAKMFFSTFRTDPMSKGSIAPLGNVLFNRLPLFFVITNLLAI